MWAAAPARVGGLLAPGTRNSQLARSRKFNIHPQIPSWSQTLTSPSAIDFFDWLGAERAARSCDRDRRLRGLCGVERVLAVPINRGGRGDMGTIVTIAGSTLPSIRRPSGDVASFFLSENGIDQTKPRPELPELPPTGTHRSMVMLRCPVPSPYATIRGPRGRPRRV
jgi:hypothetical protein